MTTIDRWRPKARDRFRDDRLVKARYASGRIETLLYHERLCDLIDDARVNEIRIQLVTLAADVLDTPRLDSAEWIASRIGILEALRDAGLVEIDGDVSAYDTMVIRLPERTYQRWHVTPRQKNASTQPRGSRGRFAPKTPAPTEDHRNGTNGDRNGTARGPVSVAHGTVAHRTETGTETGTENTTTTHRAVVAPIGAVRSSSPDPEERYDQERNPASTRPNLNAVRARLEQQLAQILVDPVDAETMARMIVQTKRRQRIGDPPRVYDVAAWERAVNVLVRDVTAGKRKVTGDPMGLLVAMVPSYETEGSDRTAAVREFGPEPVRELNADEIRAKFEQRAAALEQTDRGVAS